MGKEIKEIQDAINSINKKFGEGKVMRMSGSNINIKTVSTGRASLDSILGGGWGEGKIIEIYGEEATGKSGIALESIKAAQEKGENVAYIDMEHALNREYCDQIGLDVDSIILSQPDCGEEVFEIAKALVKTGKISMIVIDSVAAMIPRSELEGESGEVKMGLHARLMSQGLKQLTSMASDLKCTLIFINQLRATISIHGPAKKPTGGNSLKFCASQRIEIKNKGKVTVGDEVIGFKQHIKVVKNKVAPPFKEVEFEIIYGKGADKLGGIIEALMFEGILVRAGAWYKYGDINIAKGAKALRTTLEDNPELLEKLEEKLSKI